MATQSCSQITRTYSQVTRVTSPVKPSRFRLATKSFTYMNVSSAASSEFFKNATKPEWRTESRPVDLSDEQPAIFKRYCQWLYTGFIAPGLLAESSSGCLAYMYVLGEKIVDHEFQNAVIQAIISDMDRMNVVPSLRTIKIIYDGTTEESAARRLLVDSWAHTIISFLGAYEVPSQGCL
ncbi:unnamed protein product [Alternaria alternata]